MRTALVTGGTSGIGLAFARTLARDGFALVLVARDAERLEATAAELRSTAGVRVETLVADLSSRDDQARVGERAASDDVEVLVNNAGFSLKTPLVGGDVALTDRADEVMARAPRYLSGVAAESMRRRGHGRIVNVASLSALTRQDSYSALKAYTLAMTEVLASELAGTGVGVTAVLPGWVRTEFHARGGQGGKAIPGFLWLDPQVVADQAWADALAGRVVSVPTRRYRVLGTLLRILPTSAVRGLSSAIRRRRARDQRTSPTEGDR